MGHTAVGRWSSLLLTLLLSRQACAEPAPVTSAAPPPTTEPSAAFEVEPAEPTTAPPASPSSQPEPTAPPERPSPPAVDTIPVGFRTTAEGGSLTLQGPGMTANAGACGAACTLHVPPGTYTLLSSSSSGKLTSFPIELTEPSEVLVSPASPFQRGLGLAFILGGGTVASVGALTFYADEQAKLDERRYGRRYNSPDWILPVEVAGLVGFGVAVVGTALFLTAQPTADVRPQRAASAKPRTTPLRSRVSVAPAIGATRAGVRVGLSF